MGMVLATKIDTRPILPAMSAHHRRDLTPEQNKEMHRRVRALLENYTQNQSTVSKLKLGAQGASMILAKKICALTGEVAEEVLGIAPVQGVPVREIPDFESALGQAKQLWPEVSDLSWDQVGAWTISPQPKRVTAPALYELARAAEAFARPEPGQSDKKSRRRK